MKKTVCVMMLGFLAACGSGGPDRDVVLARAEAADAMVAELQALSPTSETRMPTIGAATFEGYSGLIIDPVAALDSDDVVLLGDVSITAAFAGNGSVIGTADNFVGIVGTGSDNGQLFTAQGSIDIGSGGTAIGQGRPGNEWQSTYSGEITVAGETYDVSGTLDGGFLGNRISQPDPETFIKGVYGYDDAGISFDTDGDDAPVVFEVLATNPL